MMPTASREARVAFHMPADDPRPTGAGKATQGKTEGGEGRVGGGWVKLSVDWVSRASFPVSRENGDLVRVPILHGDLIRIWLLINPFSLTWFIVLGFSWFVISLEDPKLLLNRL